MAGLVIKTARDALYDVINGWGTARKVAVHKYRPFVSPNGHHQFPYIIISHAPGGINYRTTFGPKGIAELHMQLEICTSATDIMSAEMVLDDLISAGTGATSSIFDALADDPTLGGQVESSKAIDMSPPVLKQGDGVVYWSATLDLIIYQPRS